MHILLGIIIWIIGFYCVFLFLWRVYSHKRNKAKSSLVFVLRKFTMTTNSTFVCYCIFCLKPNSIEGKDKGKFKLISLIQQQIFSFVSLLFTPIARIKKSCGSVLISQLQFGHLHCCNQVCTRSKNAALHLSNEIRKFLTSSLR